MGTRQLMRVLFHYDAGPSLRAQLEALQSDGLDVDIVPVADRERLAECLPGAEVFWHMLDPITGDMLRAAPKLRLVQKIGVGVNTIDLEAAKELGIAVCNMPGTNTRAVAEMTLLLMLGALRRIAQLDRATREGRGWSLSAEIQDQLGEIHGRTVGFVGYGAVPRMLTPVLAAMGARLLYTATAPKPDAEPDWRDLQGLLKESDIISLHAPLTPQSREMIDRQALDSMKPGAILVNTARGELVDQPALAAALKTGRLGAAGLDVFDVEPVSPTDPLLALDNVVVAPHLAWLTTNTLSRSLDVARENCRRLASGEELIHRVC